MWQLGRKCWPQLHVCGANLTSYKCSKELQDVTGRKRFMRRVLISFSNSCDVCVGPGEPSKRAICSTRAPISRRAKTLIFTMMCSPQIARVLSGHWQSALLHEVQGCRSDIINDDGSLRCSRGVGYQTDNHAGLPGGVYTQSCRTYASMAMTLKLAAQPPAAIGKTRNLMTTTNAMATL